MVAFIDQHRATYGVEPICAVLPIAPSTYFLRKAQQEDATKRSARARRDDERRAAIRRVWDENDQVYGPRKVWRQLRRPRRPLHGRAPDARHGSARRRAWSRLVRTQSAPTSVGPTDLVERRFTAMRPNQLWVADVTYVATWRGFVYVAFVIDVFARRIVGWRASASLATDFVLDALEQAIYDRRGPDVEDLVHHSDRGTQYLSMRYTQQLSECLLPLECEVLAVGQQRVLLPLDEAPILAGQPRVFGFADLVQGVAQMTQDVEFVEHDRRLWRREPRGLAKRFPHVHQRQLDAATLFLAQPRIELAHAGFGAVVATEPDRPLSIQIATLVQLRGEDLGGWSTIRRI